MIKTFKPVISRTLVLFISVSVLFSYGCNAREEVIDDYPTTVIEDEDDQEDVIEEDDGEEESDSMVDDDLLPKPDTLRETGKYVFDPEIIPDFILRYYANNPKVIKHTKQLLNAVYNADSEVTFEDCSGTGDFYNATMVATLCNPMMEAVEVIPIDQSTCELHYFGSIVLDSTDEHGTPHYAIGEGYAKEETKAIIDEFVDYITEIINDNLTADSTDRERAEVIYKQLIKDMKFSFEKENPFKNTTYTDAFKDSIQRGETVYGVINREFYREGPYMKLYSFILGQLHMEVYEINGRGIFKNDYDKYLERNGVVISSQEGKMENVDVTLWYWSIVEIDGNNYICDLVLEKLVYDSYYEDNAGIVDPDMLFFGLSDETRNESFKTKNSDQVCLNIVNDMAVGGATPFNRDGTSPRDIPECLNDLE